MIISFQQYPYKQPKYDQEMPMADEQVAPPPPQAPPSLLSFVNAELSSEEIVLIKSMSSIDLQVSS